MRNRKQEVKLTLKRYKKLIQKNINSRKNVRRNTKPNCICKLCHIKYYEKPSIIKKFQNRFCSRSCYNIYRLKTTFNLVKCEFCNKEFYLLKKYIKFKKIFCSHKCVGYFHSGKNNYKWKGGTPYCIDCGRKLQLYTASRCRRCYGKYQSKTFIGKLHHRWLGGKSSKNNLLRNSKKNRKWTLDVFKRDNFICQSCGIIGSGNLTPHHLEGWHWCEKLRFEVNNGVTLCKNCHFKFHIKYGKYWNTTEQFVEFIHAT